VLRVLKVVMYVQMMKCVRNVLLGIITLKIAENAHDVIHNARIVNKLDVLPVMFVSL